MNVLRPLGIHGEASVLAWPCRDLYLSDPRASLAGAYGLDHLPQKSSMMKFTPRQYHAYLYAGYTFQFDSSLSAIATLSFTGGSYAPWTVEAATLARNRGFIPDDHDGRLLKKVRNRVRGGSEGWPPEMPICTTESTGRISVGKQYNYNTIDRPEGGFYEDYVFSKFDDSIEELAGTYIKHAPAGRPDPDVSGNRIGIRWDFKPRHVFFDKDENAYYVVPELSASLQAVWNPLIGPVGTSAVGVTFSTSHFDPRAVASLSNVMPFFAGVFKTYVGDDLLTCPIYGQTAQASDDPSFYNFTVPAPNRNSAENPGTMNALIASLQLLRPDSENPDANWGGPNGPLVS